jgi:acetylornithine/LysW-gamma-L-lysine aminotransferase
VPYLRALMAEGVLALPAGKSVLRLLPPLIISDQELARVCDAVEKVLTAPLDPQHADADE